MHNFQVFHQIVTFTQEEIETSPKIWSKSKKYMLLGKPLSSLSAQIRRDSPKNAILLQMTCWIYPKF